MTLSEENKTKQRKSDGEPEARAKTVPKPTCCGETANEFEMSGERELTVHSLLLFMIFVHYRFANSVPSFTHTLTHSVA